MTLEIGLVFLIVLATVILFAFEIFPMDKVSFCLIGVLALTGLVSPQEAISGFSNRAVITILCLMIIAAALEQNGVISWMANGLKVLRNWSVLVIVPAFMLITGSISAFISSTAVVIVFVKIVTELHDKFDISKSRLLLPISYASILGGSCTLMGTSTNLLVDSLAKDRIGQGFEFFEFSWLGVIFLLAAVLLVSLLQHLLPADSGKKLQDQYRLESYILTLEISADSSLVGKKLVDTFLHKASDITILKLFREAHEINPYQKDLTLYKGDRLVLSCNLDHLLRLKSAEEFIITPREPGETISPLEFRDLEGNQKKEQPGRAKNTRLLVELMMLPGARFLGNSLGELRLNLKNNAIPVAIKKRKNLRYFKDRLYMNDADLTRLKVGDRVLVEIDREGIEDFDLYDNIAVLQQYEAPEIAKSSKRNLTLLILAGVVLFAASGLLDILTSTIFGCMLLLLTDSISLQNVYRKLDWPILFLIAGMIPLGVAMHNSGADDWLSNQLLSLMHGQPPLYSIGLLFLATMLLSGFVSNNATAIIMTPIAISLATGMEVTAKPYILAVMFASNFSFFTPVGYQTNALVYSMGLYKFKHFAILGGIVSLLLWILASILLNSMLP